MDSSSKAEQYEFNSKNRGEDVNGLEGKRGRESVLWKERWGQVGALSLCWDLFIMNRLWREGWNVKFYCHNHELLFIHLKRQRECRGCFCKFGTVQACRTFMWEHRVCVCVFVWQTVKGKSEKLLHPFLHSKLILVMTCTDAEVLLVWACGGS